MVKERQSHARLDPTWAEGEVAAVEEMGVGGTAAGRLLRRRVASTPRRGTEVGEVEEGTSSSNNISSNRTNHISSSLINSSRISPTSRIRGSGDNLGGLRGRERLALAEGRAGIEGDEQARTVFCFFLYITTSR